MKRRALAASIAVLMLATACSRRTVQDDIVLITVDTLRADRLGLYGYGRGTTPQLDRWFAEGVVHERAYATAASTSPSVVSLLTGLYPSEHRVRLLYQLVPDDVRLVTDGCRFVSDAAIVSNVVLTDSAGIAHRFDHYDAVVDEGVGRDVTSGAERTTDAVMAWFATRRIPHGLFLWVRIDPHGRTGRRSLGRHAPPRVRAVEPERISPTCACPALRTRSTTSTATTRRWPTSTRAWTGCCASSKRDADSIARSSHSPPITARRWPSGGSGSATAGTSSTRSCACRCCCADPA
jgi:hypothetical protein